MPLAQLLLITFVPTLIIVGIHWVFRLIVPPKALAVHNDVTGFLIAVVGVLYAVALGFVVVTVAVAFDSAQSNADTEAGNVAELVGIARLLPEPGASALQQDMARYAFEVRDVEFPILQDGKQDLKARGYLQDALSAVSAPSKAAISNETLLRDLPVRQEAMNYLHDLNEHRHHRLIDAAHHLPRILYAALCIGALAVFAFVFLFGVDRAATQLTMTGLVAASIFVLLAVVYLLDRPYSGAYRVTPEAWTLVIENDHLEQYR